MKRLFLVMAALIGIVGVSTAQADAVSAALSTRHMEASNAQLESAAGGKEALVARLLELRKDENTPFVGIRAEKILLDYADHPAVHSALAEDVQSEQLVGLARIVAVNVDKITNSEVRQNLARMAIERGTKDATFRPYAKTLTASTDTQISAQAKAAFGG